MFRPMRRKNRELSTEAAEQLLEQSRRGVLAVHGEDGYPYAVPVNYFYDREAQKIYFHGARAGHKIDALKANDKVCFTVYGNESIKKEAWAPFVQSTVVFGRCHLLESGPEAMEHLRQMARKYYPEEGLVEQEIEAAGKAVQMFAISIEHLTGKEIQEK